MDFLLNISFEVNYRGAFRSIVAIAINLLTSEDQYFLWITVVPLPRRCLQSDNIRYHACAVLHSRWAGHPICDPSRIIATWFSYCSVNPSRSQNCINFQSDLSCLYKLNCNIFNHHERLYYTPRTTKLLGGILVSLRLSVRLSVRPSVRPSRLPCPLCNFYSSGWILSILATNDHYHERLCRTQWPLTFTYILKVIWPWLRKSCPLCSVHSSEWILFICGTNDHYH